MMTISFSICVADLMTGVDSSGIYGAIFHYSLIFAIAGSALLAFLYFWRKGALDMDESPKMQMMQEGERDDKEGRHG